MTDNYFKVVRSETRFVYPPNAAAKTQLKLYGIVFFDAGDPLSILSAWKDARDIAFTVPGARVCVFQPVPLKGPWSVCPTIGETTHSLPTILPAQGAA